MEIATYKYQRMTGVYPFKKFEVFNMKVEIIDDTGKRLRVKFLGYHADGRTPGTVIMVERKSVKRVGDRPLSDTVSKLNIFRDYDPDLIRKPYKDD